MNMRAAVVEHDVAISQGKSFEKERRGAERERDEDPFARQRHVGNARQVFMATINLQMLQFQPRQAGLEVSGAGYGQIEAYTVKPGCVSVGVAERECTAS